MRKKGDPQLVPVNKLFERYRQVLKAPEGVVIDAFVEVVEDLFSVQVPKERVSYKPYTKTLSVAISGALKSELKVREKEVLTHLKGRLGAQSAPKTIL